MNISFACKECGYMIIESNKEVNEEIIVECDHCKMKYKVKIKLKYNKKEDGD